MRAFGPILSCLACLAAGAVWAQSGDVPVQPLPKNAEDVNYTGTWRYVTGQPTVSGVCPAGSPMAGELSITQEDALAQVLIVSGAICDPDFSCVYTGVIEDGELIVANSGIVDEEGGKVTNELRMYFYSDVSGGAESTSEYVHPKGFSCAWSSYMTMTRGD